VIALLAALLLPQDGGLRAGAATVDVTPTKWPVVVNGHFTERSAGQAHDRILVRSLVLDDGRTKLAIAVVDSCMVPRSVLDAAKELASAATAIPVERMLVSSTHTHSAPSSMGCLGSDADPDYPEPLKKGIAEAIEKAHGALVPAEAGWGAVDAPEHTFNRRWILRSDKIRGDPFGERNVRANMHPGYQNPDFIGPSGPVDPQLGMLAVRSREGKPIALLANFSMHYFGAPPVSSDHCGLFCRRFEALAAPDGGFVAILSQGTSGDLMWMDYGSPQKKLALEEYAEGLVQIARDAWKKIAYRKDVPLAMREAKLQLWRRVAPDARLAWARGVVEKLAGRKPQTQQEVYAREQILIAEDRRAELKLQAIRIGELGITALPNEVFAITGLKLKAQSPLPLTLNIELANGAEGYIPPPEQHTLGGYTTWAARTAGLEVQAEPRIVETLLRLLEEVSGRPRRPFAEPTGAGSQAVLDSKPLAYWRLGEWNGPTAADATGNGNSAAYEDRIALYLEGSPGIPRNRAPHLAGGRIRADFRRLGSSYSVELWFWNGFPLNVRPITGHLFSRGEGDVLALNGAGRLALGELAGKTEIPPKTWTQVAFVRDGRGVKVYLNGALEISGDAPLPSGQTLSIGGREDGAFNFEGKIDEASVHHRALPEDEVKTHYRAAKP
jgi:hypothetical protein